MKKVLFGLTVSLTLTVAHGQTATYHPFPDSNAVWNEGCVYLQNNTPVNNPQIFFLAGDTLISAITYKKVLTSGYKYYMIPSNNCCFYYNQPAGDIRQDTAQRKIYLHMSPSDVLLYDFNLNIGDTLPVSYINYQGSGNYVSSIDSVLVGTTYRKQYHISTNVDPNGFGIWDSNYVQLIEGIGSTFGLFSPLLPPFEGGCSLNCYSENNVVLYTNANSTCDMTVGINENNTADNFVNIYPNPFSSQTTLQTDNLFKNATLTVYNSYGQTVKQIKNISGQTITLFRDNIPSGLYFLRLTQDNKTFSADKLIITD